MAKKIWGGKKITEIIQDAEEKRGQLGALFESSQKSVNQIDSAASDAKTKLENISSVVENAKEALISVQYITSTIQGEKDEVVGLKSSAQELLEKSKTLAEEIKVQLGTAAGGSLSLTFDGRKSELEKSKDNWRVWFLWNIVALFVVAFVVFWELKTNQGFSTILWLKITLAFPLIYSAIFFHTQYNKEREYVEEYAFKSAVAFSLQAYKKLFEDEIDPDKPEEQEKLLNFISDTTKQIYTSPREIIATHPSKQENVELGVLDKLIDMIKKLKG